MDWMVTCQRIDPASNDTNHDSSRIETIACTRRASYTAKERDQFLSKIDTTCIGAHIMDKGIHLVRIVKVEEVQ
jgi:hypothetical protein